METREILGNEDKEDNNERWFGERDVAIYDQYVARRAYDGTANVSIYGIGTASWDVEFHGGFDDLADGELPEGTTEDEVYDILAAAQQKYQVPIYAANTGFSIKGIDLGSNNFKWR